MNALKNVSFCLYTSLRQQNSLFPFPIHVRNYQSFLGSQPGLRDCLRSRNLSIGSSNPFSITSSASGRLSWLNQTNNQQNNNNDLLKRKEKALAKALKNKYELELKTLEKIRKHHFDLLEDLIEDERVNKIQSPRFNQIKQMAFQIHQEQIERIQEAIDVKNILIIQGDKDDVFAKIDKMSEIMQCETKYHQEQIESIKKCLVAFDNQLQRIVEMYSKDPDEKNLEIMKSFVHKHQKQLEEQIQRHEEIMQRYKRYIEVNVD
ncbi:hypothetical protein WDU94_005056 [Cyamophila willieti]